MRKITLCSLLFICFSFLATAQNKQTLNKNSTTVLSSTNAQNSNGFGIQLNQENLSVLNSNLNDKIFDTLGYKKINFIIINFLQLLFEVSFI